MRRAVLKPPVKQEEAANPERPDPRLFYSLRPFPLDSFPAAPYTKTKTGRDAARPMERRYFMLRRASPSPFRRAAGGAGSSARLLLRPERRRRRFAGLQRAAGRPAGKRIPQPVLLSNGGSGGEHRHAVPVRGSQADHDQYLGDFLRPLYPGNAGTRRTCGGVCG